MCDYLFSWFLKEVCEDSLNRLCRLVVFLVIIVRCVQELLLEMLLVFWLGLFYRMCWVLNCEFGVMYVFMLMIGLILVLVVELQNLLVLNMFLWLVIFIVGIFSCFILVSMGVIFVVLFSIEYLVWLCRCMKEDFVDELFIGMLVYD